jgi:glycosyltransferase involved in cell wall biosynthesis
VRICIVYDHLYPQTIGGAERWLRDLAVRLAAGGHEVTYLTMRHWLPGADPSLPGVRVLGLVPAGAVYADARRTLGPPVRFGIAVARHLLRHGREYDVVHAGSFPYFSLLGAALARRRGGYELEVEWYEVWTRGYWRRYAGTLVGTAGWLVQRACIRLPHRAYCLAQLTARRLIVEGYRGRPVVLPGIYGGSLAGLNGDGVDPARVVYAGRHVREKRLDALVRGFAWARRQRPDLRLDLYGDGPDRQRIEQIVQKLGLGDAVGFAGRRTEEEVAVAFARAACVATASEREGYGLIVVEAAAHGTPSVVVSGPENAATELVHEGVNGAIAADASAEQIGSAILRVVAATAVLRESTKRWFAETADTLRLDRSLDVVLESYAA